MEKENFLQVLLEIWGELPELIGNDWPNFGSSVIPVEATRYSVAKKKQKSDNH